MKRLLTAVLLLSLMVGCLTGCGGKKGGDTAVTVPATSNSTPSEPEPTSTQDAASVTPSSADDTLTVCDIDFFSTCTSSKYLSCVLYNPNGKESTTEDRHKQTETIVVTLPIGENDLWNGDFLYAYDEDGGYFNGIGGSGWFIPLFSCYEQFYNLLSPERSMYLYEPTGAQRTLDALDRPLQEIRAVSSPAILCPELTGDSMTATSQPGTFSTGSGWGYFLPNGETPSTASSLYLPLTEGTDGSVCYAKMFLTEEIPFSDEALTAAAAKGIFSDVCSYSAVADMEQLDEPQCTLGNAPKLSETVFYQDIIAQYISRKYGLNLRSKYLYLATTTDAISYYGRDDYGAKGIQLAAFVSDNPEALKESSIDSFSYTDRDGTQYSYYFTEESDYEGFYIYVFRNDVLQGRLTDWSRNYNDTAKSIMSDFFGIRP